MDDYKLGVVERRFADLIWDNEPISSGELVKLCEGDLSERTGNGHLPPLPAGICRPPKPAIRG